MSEVSIHGIVLVAENFDDQVSFYRDTIGLEMTDDWGDAVRFRSANGVELTLFAHSHDTRSVQRLSPRRHGISHLEFAATSEQRNELESKLGATPHAGHGDNFVDCDGQLFHFVTASK